MTVSGFVYLCVPAEEDGIFLRHSWHGVTAAPEEHLAPQGVGPGVFLDPLAFILHPNPVPTYLRHIPFSDDISAGVPFIVQDMHHGANVIQITRKGSGVMGIYTSDAFDTSNFPDDWKDLWQDEWQGKPWEDDWWQNTWQEDND